MSQTIYLGRGEKKKKLAYYSLALVSSSEICAWLRAIGSEGRVQNDVGHRPFTQNNFLGPF